MFHIHIPKPALIGTSVMVWIGIAAAINAGVSNDWRAQYDMDLQITEHRSSVARNIRIDKK